MYFKNINKKGGNKNTNQIPCVQNYYHNFKLFHYFFDYLTQKCWLFGGIVVDTNLKCAMKNVSHCADQNIIQ